MRMLIHLFVVFAICAVGIASPADAQDMRQRKKLIATGWDKPDSQRLLENLAEMEKQPFDGVVIEVTGKKPDGKPCGIRATFSNQKWEQEWFQPVVDQLKAGKFQRFTDNFVTLGANPGNVDWFDDEGWKNIVEHWRIGAWIAKQSGFKGILFDPEPYTKPFAQYSYNAQPDRDKHTFAEYYAKARQRGREVMQAVAQEYPDATLFCYFLNSICMQATGRPDPRLALASHGYGLLPAMLDGWLDAAPPTVRIVDGCESAYHFNSVAQYLEAGLGMKGCCQELVSPENRGKYRGQVQVSFGMYLDAYWNPKESPWYIDGLGGSRVDRLRANTATALRVADEYVWIYGEKFRWWPTPNGGVRKEYWPEAIPGSDRALRFARDPEDFGRTEIAELQKAGKLVNLARNGDFSVETAKTFEGTDVQWREGRAPAGWSTWQEEKSKGSFTWDRETGAHGKGAARAAGVAGGCFIQSYPVKPGQRYAVRAVQKVQGRGDGHLRVRWQTSAGTWTQEVLDKLIFVDKPQGEWNELFGVVEIPEGVGRLTLLLGASGQTSPEDVLWYDEVEVHQLP
ncbi:MAG: hypothetical protein ABFD16_17075 [Thermoguttaceae bacterium]